MAREVFTTLQQGTDGEPLPVEVLGTRLDGALSRSAQPCFEQRPLEIRTDLRRSLCGSITGTRCRETRRGALAGWGLGGC